MMEIKYIMTKDGPIMFPSTFTHDQFSNFNPTSAGYVALGNDAKGRASAICYGHSVSLKLKSNENDTRDINETFFDLRDE